MNRWNDRQKGIQYRTHTSSSISLVTVIKSPSSSISINSLVRVVTWVDLILVRKVDREVSVDKSKIVSVGIDDVITDAMIEACIEWVVLCRWWLLFMLLYAMLCCCPFSKSRDWHCTGRTCRTEERIYSRAQQQYCSDPSYPVSVATPFLLFTSLQVQ